MSFSISRSILPAFSALFFLIFSIQNHFVSAKFGKAYNIYEKLEKADFKCLLPYGEVPVIRIYAGGNVDQNGIKNIENAQAAGYTGTEVYVQPAVLISSKSGSQQFEEAYKFVNDIYPVQRIWLFVTDPRTWTTNPKANLQFIRDFVRAGKTKNVVVGIYTSWYDWLLIMGDYKELQNDCAEGNCPLWYWHTFGQGRNAQTSQDFADFRPFGSWKTPAVKEYDIVDNQICGRNLNWSVFSLSKNKIRSMPNRRGIFNRKIEVANNVEMKYKFIIGNAF